MAGVDESNRKRELYEAFGAIINVAPRTADALVNTAGRESKLKVLDYSSTSPEDIDQFAVNVVALCEALRAHALDGKVAELVGDTEAKADAIRILQTGLRDDRQELLSICRNVVKYPQRWEAVCRMLIDNLAFEILDLTPRRAPPLGWEGVHEWDVGTREGFLAYLRSDMLAIHHLKKLNLLKKRDLKETVRNTARAIRRCGLKGNLPQRPSGDRLNACDVIDYLEALVDVCESETSEPTDSHAAVENSPPAKWPPDDGWHFRPGEAAFRATVFEIVGQSWKLLRMLAENVRPVSWAEISEHLASDSNTQLERENVRVHVKDLRKTLRLRFDCGTSDPIPFVDRGAQLAWRLDLSVLQPHSKSV
jgi:hypothetical protein